MSNKAPAGGASTAAGGRATAGRNVHTVGYVSLVAFAVGTMVGGGVFALSGIVVKDAGPGAIIAYVVAGLVMVLSAMSFAAVSSRANTGETGYSPIGPELGNIWRFITMWAFYITGVTGVAFVLISFGTYLHVMIKDTNYAHFPLIAALAAAAVLIALNFGPAGLVAKAEIYMVGFKVTVLIIMVVFGFVHLAGKVKNFEPFVPSGWGSVMAATALLFTAYTGFNVITNMAGSVENPQKTVPRAILASLGIVGVIYVGVAVTLIVGGLKDKPDFQNEALTMTAQSLMGHWGFWLVGLAALVSTLSGANANLIGSADLIVRMSKMGSLPKSWGSLNKKGNPAPAVTVTGVLVIALMLLRLLPGDAGTNILKTIVVFSNVAAIIAMVIVDATALKMALNKWKIPGMKLPGGPLIPALAIITALAQIPQLGWGKVAIGTLMVAAGVPIYLRYHKKGQPDTHKMLCVAPYSSPLHRALLSIELLFNKNIDIHSAGDCGPDSESNEAVTSPTGAKHAIDPNTAAKHAATKGSTAKTASTAKPADPAAK